MVRRFASACLALSTLAVAHAGPLEDKLRSLDLPPEVQMAPWEGVLNRTLVAWTTPSAPVTGDEDALDLHLVVLAIDSGEVIASDTFARAYTADWQPHGLSLLALDFGLAPGRPSFAIDMLESHTGCASTDATTRALYELDGGHLALLKDEIFLSSRTNFCSGGESSELTTTVGSARTRHAGHADLVLEQERTESTCDAGDRCRETGPVTTRQVLRFDGRSYVPAGPPRAVVRPKKTKR